MIRLWWRRGALAAGLILLLYLAAWPVPIDPVAWTPPENAGFTGRFAENERLAGLELVDLAGRHGAEDIAPGPDGRLYFATREGWISSIGTDGGLEDWVRLEGGMPLGLEFGKDGLLYVADAHLGLVTVAADGTVAVVADAVEGTPILYADDVDVAPDGTVFFSDASMRFGAEAWGTLEASVLDMIEARATGRLLAYDPATGDTRVVAGGFSFANGVAVSEDGDFLLLAETGAYRVWKVWLRGPRAGEREEVIAGLPGFPDNVQRDADGRFWVGLVSPRRWAIDGLAGWPGVRAVTMRLPAALRPKPLPYAAVFAIDGDGRVLANLQDPSGRYALSTGAIVHDGFLYVSSLAAPQLARLPVAEAGLDRPLGD